MAELSPDIERTICTICTKGTLGTLRCEGCLKIFCSSHVMQHRQDLTSMLETMDYKRDLIQQTLLQYIKSETINHPLIVEIDEWEKISIQTIHAAAEEAKRDLLKMTSCRTNDIHAQLKQLTDELRQGRQKDDFLESNLKDWTRRLTELENEVKYLATLRLRRHPLIPLIPKISVEYEFSNELFEQNSGHVILDDHRRVVIKDSTNGYTEVRGKNEYQTGKHVLKFRIEKLDQGGWIFMGINSKSTAVQENSWKTSTCYGWQNHEYTIRAGTGVYGEGSEAVQNDKIKMVIDCDQKLLSLTNERAKHTCELSVDTDRCPLPWQVHLNLYQSGARIRILPE